VDRHRRHASRDYSDSRDRPVRRFLVLRSRSQQRFHQIEIGDDVTAELIPRQPRAKPPMQARADAVAQQITSSAANMGSG
jgi:hypothetical protein